MEAAIDLRMPGELTHHEFHGKFLDIHLTDHRVTARRTLYLVDLFPTTRTFHAVRLDAVSHVALARSWRVGQLIVGVLVLAFGALGMLRAFLGGVLVQVEYLVMGLLFAAPFVLLGVFLLLDAKRLSIRVYDGSGAGIVAPIRRREREEATAFVRAVGARLT